MKALILAEKPSVGREIARVLGLGQIHKNFIEGKQYIVTRGDLVELKMPEHYDPKYKTWRLEKTSPLSPSGWDSRVIKQTSHQFKAIENLAKRPDIKEVIIATDAGREGELVARWILEKIRLKKPIKRLWISSVTDRAIREGFRRLKPGKQFEICTIPLFVGTNLLADRTECFASFDNEISRPVIRRQSPNPDISPHHRTGKTNQFLCSEKLLDIVCYNRTL